MTATFPGASYGYLDVLDDIAGEMGRAGSNYDRPTMLFADGKQVIFEGRLTDIAYDYRTERQAAMDRVMEEVRAKWLLTINEELRG